MVGVDTVKNFRCNLKYLSLHNYAINKQMEVQTHSDKPNEYKEPQLASFVAKSQNLSLLDLQKAKLLKLEVEYLSQCLNPSLHVDQHLIILNLNQNKLGSTFVKLLFNGFKTNQIVRSIDLSGNQIGVSGVVAICNVLKSNGSIENLSLFSNKVSFDGAKSLGQALQQNTTLKFLDLGCNRIRDKGALQLTKGLQKSGVEEIALNWNFISDEGFYKILENLLEAKSLKKLYIKNNQLSNSIIKSAQQLLNRNQSQLYVDVFRKLEFLSTEQLGLSIWIYPVRNLTKRQIIDFFEKNLQIGVVSDCRIRQGKKKGKKGDQVYAFVEFAHANSVVRALHLAAKKLAVINGKNIKIYRASTKGISDKGTAQSTLYGDKEEEIVF